MEIQESDRECILAGSITSDGDNSDELDKGGDDDGGIKPPRGRGSAKQGGFFSDDIFYDEDDLDIDY